MRNDISEAISRSFRESVEAADLSNLREFSRRSWKSEIDNVDPAKSWTHEHVWKFEDGTEARVNGKYVNDIVLPANPGLTAIFVECSGNELKVGTEPVIGWRLAVDNHNGMEFEPIVPYQQADPWESYVGVAQPDGRVLWWGRWFNNQAAFVEAVKSHRQQIERDKVERDAAQNCPSCGGRRHPVDRESDIPF